MTEPDLGPAPRLHRTKSLKDAGWTDRAIHTAVAEGRLVKLRDGAYCDPGTDPDCVTAGRLRGRLTCVSEMRRRGVFVLDRSVPHVHIDPTVSRRRSLPGSETVHRQRLRRTPDPDALSIDPFDALLDAVACQSPRAAIATIDSAFHHGLLRLDELDEFFLALPRRFRRLKRLIDVRAESGPESFVRLILRTLKCSFETQVFIPGVGRVDFLVDGWLIIECDSREFHSSWEAQREDRRRDRAAAERGHATLRLVASEILGSPDAVRRAIDGLLSARPC